MRFDIRYRTVFRYERPVAESHNELRACPSTTDFQRLLSYRVTVMPSARVHSFTDYWGTRVDTFGVRSPHTELEVVAEAAVETSPRPAVTAAPQVSELFDPGFRRDHLDELEPTVLTSWNDELETLARTILADNGQDLIGTVLAIHRLVRNNVAYEPGQTDVETPATEVWRRGAGVCQDHAHVAIALCRSVGIPARYVSGYLFSDHLGGLGTVASEPPTADSPGHTVDVQTHAWFEVPLPGGGTLALDPTNGRQVSDHHVRIGHGRDYGDVTPLHGVHLGQATVSLEAGVTIARSRPLHAAPGSEEARGIGWAPVPVTNADRRYPDPFPQHQHQQHQQQQQQQQQQRLGGGAGG